MKILLTLCLLYAQLSNASHLRRSIIDSKHSLFARSRVESELLKRTDPVPVEVVASSWYASWHSADFPLSDICWSKYDRIIYSFASTTSDVNTIGLQPSDQALLPDFVSAAKLHNVIPMLSIGGWGGSVYFSSVVATPENRTAFAKAVMGVVAHYGLGGIEFDWEFPGRQGIGCNVVSPDDTANFLSFLQVLRSQEGACDLIITAAASLKPFVCSDGQPRTDVSEFGKVLDNIHLMVYDIWGVWSPTTGPNAPLDDSCAASPQGSAKSAVKAWTTAGFPQNKIILGVPSYGHSFLVDRANAFCQETGDLQPYAPFEKSLQPAGDKWDNTGGSVDFCGNPTVVGGIFDFWGLISAGFLDQQGKAAPGINYTFDSCSQTPFVYNSTSQVLVAYDNAQSFLAKGNYIKEAGLAGFIMWQTGGDSNDILLDAINSAFDDCDL